MVLFAMFLALPIMTPSLLPDEASTQARDKGELSEGSPLPQQLSNLFELIMFVKNLELSCDSQFASKAGRLGSK